MSLVHHPIALADTEDMGNLKDQLVTIQSSQVDEQLQALTDQRGRTDSSLRQDFVSGSQIAKAVVTLLPPRNNIPASEYPLGLRDASVLDESYNGESASMICTAIGKEGPPLAAKKFHLNQLKFPFFVEMNMEDLLFPYTKEAWLQSPVSNDNVAMTCVLDSDGKLATSVVSDRYGFGISDLIIDDKEIKTRGEAKLNIGLQADGRPYAESELQLLESIDKELDGKGFSTAL